MTQTRRPASPDPRPIQPFETTLDLARLVTALRRTIQVRQEDLALRAHVSRQWIVGLEQGKPTLEIALVLRTLETLGLEFFVRPADPLPPWILRAKSDAALRRLQAQRRRNARRRHVYANAREAHLCRNAPRIWPDLE